MNLTRRRKEENLVILVTGGLAAVAAHQAARIGDALTAILASLGSGPPDLPFEIGLSGVLLVASAGAALAYRLGVTQRSTGRTPAGAGESETPTDGPRTIGNYTLVDRLGSGGMGEVWLAQHQFLPQPAAIKFIRPEALGGGSEEAREEVVRRFEREARATVRLTSPNTIRIYDYGVGPDDNLCYVMEFLEGRDLESLVREHGPLPPARVVYFLRQVCIALAEAHATHFIHRDIKPANIYACRKGIHWDFVKVLDFGMVAGPVSGGKGEPAKSGGSPSFMAPEIALRQTFDGRADIYSLGCVGYWLLTGLPVFDGDTVEAKIMHHVHSRPNPPSSRTDRPIPRDLELVIMKCLAKNPDDRWGNVLALSRALAACNVGERWTPGRAMNWWTHEGGADDPWSGAPWSQEAEPGAGELTVAEVAQGSSAEMDAAGFSTLEGS